MKDECFYKLHFLKSFRTVLDLSATLILIIMHFEYCYEVFFFKNIDVRVVFLCNLILSDSLSLGCRAALLGTKIKTINKNNFYSSINHFRKSNISNIH